MKRLTFITGLLAILLAGCSSVRYIAYTDGKNNMEHKVKELEDKGCRILDVIEHKYYIYEIIYKEPK